MDREVDPNPAKPADFGLDPPAAEVRLDVKGRKDPLVLLVGAKSPTGAWVYAKEGGKSAVMTISEVAGRDVARPVGDFRDKTVIAFDKKNVSGVDLEVGGDQILLISDEPRKWRIVKPNAYRADSDMVSDFLDKLESAKIKEFVADSPPSLAPYGLDKPATVTIWTGKDKDRSSKTLLFGRGDLEKKGVYVMRAGEPAVMLVPDELWTVFPKTVAALRDKTVVTYAADKANKFEVESPKGNVVIEKDAAGWKITAPAALKADSGAVNALLWSLRDLRASGFVGESPADIARLIKKPEVTVQIWEEGREGAPGAPAGSFPRDQRREASRRCCGGRAGAGGPRRREGPPGSLEVGDGSARQGAAPGLRAERREAGAAHGGGQAARRGAQRHERLEGRRALAWVRQGRQGQQSGPGIEVAQMEGDRVAEGRRRRALRPRQSGARGEPLQSRRRRGWRLC
jgi:hypothetical protein